MVEEWLYKHYMYHCSEGCLNMSGCSIYVTMVTRYSIFSIEHRKLKCAYTLEMAQSMGRSTF